MEHIRLGRFNQLEVLREVDFGVYLDGKDDGDILLPKKEVPADTHEGDWLNVFVYLDQEERLVASTLTPVVQVGDFAYLEVAWVNEYGAFLKWGLLKDLFCPFREQNGKMQQGKRYVIRCYEDEQTHRIAASARINRFLSKEMPPYSPGDEVNLFFWQITDLGYKVVVDGKYSGLVYRDEVFRAVHAGDKMPGYVKLVREDGKIDIALQPSGRANVVSFADKFLQYLQAHDGHSTFHDKSSADEIAEEFGVSKKTFKKGVGELYKKRFIKLTDNGIDLVKKK